jgi:Flp pilus assembly protein TadD
MPTADELYQEAESLKDAGKNEEAVSKLNELLTQDESCSLAHMALAVIYGKLDKHEDAIRHAEKACELEPNDAFSFTAMSVTYQRAWQGTQNPQFIQLAETAMARAHALQSGG